MTSPLNAILIIHGAYFQPESWSSVITPLMERNFTVECPALPSCGSSPSQHPTGTLQDDVDVIRTAAQKLIDASYKLTVLAHSYGGLVASEAITRDLYAANTPSGAGVASLILLSAFLIQPGHSLPGLFKKYGFQCEVDLGYNEDETVSVKNAVKSLYNDVRSDTVEWLASGNVMHNIAAAAGNVMGAPWKDLETIYVYLVQDLAIRLSLQRSMVKDAARAGGRIQTEVIDAGHCAFLSRPDEVVEIVLRVTGRS
ncbi:alpha/beta-hydrolase [Aspergillus germanicus]